MAGFETTGIEGLALSLEEVADLPEDVLLKMLEAEGEVVRGAQEKRLKALTFTDETTGQLEDSISMTHRLKRDRSGTPGISVYPGGVRRDGKTRNAEVGFLVEHGAPRRGIAPRQWMRVANEESAEEAAAAAGAVYERYLREKGL